MEWEGVREGGAIEVKCALLARQAESRLSCFNAKYLRGASRPTFIMNLETPSAGKPLKQKKEFLTRVVSRGKYSLLQHRPKNIISQTGEFLRLSVGGFNEREEELSAALFSQPVRGGHTMEVIMPFPGGAAAGGEGAPLTSLLATYAAGSTERLMVLVGAIDVLATGAIKVVLSLPKTKSKSLTLCCKVGGTIEVTYAAPVSSVHAFFAALTLSHWINSTAPSSALIP